MNCTKIRRGRISAIQFTGKQRSSAIAMYVKVFSRRNLPVHVVREDVIELVDVTVVFEQW